MPIFSRALEICIYIYCDTLGFPTDFRFARIRGTVRCAFYAGVMDTNTIYAIVIIAVIAVALIIGSWLIGLSLIHI